MIIVVLHGMKKAITTHIDISHSARQNQNRVFFSLNETLSQNKYVMFESGAKHFVDIFFCSL